MATTTYTLIARQTVGSGGASSVTFSSIPQNFTDLKVVWSGRTTRNSTGSYAYISFNGSTSTFSGLLLGGYGTGTTSASQTQPGGIETDANATASTFANNEIYIPNYTSSNYKSFSVDGVSENNGSTGFDYLFAGLWGTGSAITSLTLTPESGGNWTEFSTFYLYGISNSSTQIASNIPYALGGDVIVNDGTYWYHAFKYSGTFTPLKGITADCLVIAGGGGGAANTAGAQSGGVGGGGAGGLRLLSSQSLGLNSYTVTIGSGGAGSSSSGVSGSNGNNSSFAGTGLTTITSSGGGGGAGTVTGNGSAGGSGGGSYGYPLNSYSGGAGNAGSYSPVEGYAGGKGYTDGLTYTTGGGGGGSAAAATQKTSNSGGDGGAGTQLTAWANATGTGVSGYYAGGGGGGASGGTGGTGAAGGGNGSTPGAAASSAVANTGSGGGGVGGGSATVYTGGTGGSGLVIIRYAI